MADASFTWTSFLGGEWSTYYQGRTEDPRYKTALNLCLNAYPLEEGAWTRRPGFRWCAPTHGGGYARIHGYNFSALLPYTIELTSRALRMFSGPNVVLDPTTVADIVNISTTTPVQVTVSPAVNPTPNDGIVELLLTTGLQTSFAVLRNRQFYVTTSGNGIYSLYDPLTMAAIDGSEVYWDGTAMTGQMASVWTATTPYGSGGDGVTNSWDNVRVIQQGSTAVLTNPSDSPYALTITAPDYGDGRFSQFTFTPIVFSDGPYFDAQLGQTCTPSGTSGNIIVTFSGGFGPRGAASVSDVGKPIRLFSEPLVYDETHTYAIGDAVTVNTGTQSLYYTALQANTAMSPTLNPAFWQLTPEAAIWAWGYIVSWGGFSEVEVALVTDLLYTNTVNSWRLGLWGGVDGWPQAGTFHGGRLWFGYNNQIIASQPNNPYNMSPTEPDGTVTDASAITYTLQAGVEDSNDINWMFSDLQGIVAGTYAGEWLIQASNLNDPLTATTTDARKVTKYGCGFVSPVKTGLALVFVQKFGHKLMEFLADVFTGKFVAPNLTTAAKHLTQNGVKEIVYCEELTPIIWARDGAHLLRGATYRRSSAWSTEPPAFIGWHQHVLGGGQGIYSLANTTSPDGTLDVLNIVTKDQAGYYHVQQSTKMFDVADPLTSAWFLDDASTPVAAVDIGTGLTLYGYSYLAGQTASVWAGGLDCGDYTVGSDGTLTVPYQSDPDGTFTKTYLQGLSDTSPSATTLYVTVNTTPARSPTGPTVGSFSDATEEVFFTDFATNRLIMYDTLSTTLVSYDITTRAQIATDTVLDVTGSATTLWGGAVGSDSNFYVQGAGGSRPMLFKIDPTTWTVISTFGDGASDLVSGPNGIQYTDAAATTFANGTNFLVTVNKQTTGVQVVNVDTMQWAAFTAGTAALDSFATRGFVGSVGTVFTIDKDASGGSSAVIREVIIGGAAGTYSSAVQPYIAGNSYDYGVLVLNPENGQTYASLTTNNNATPSVTGSTADWGILKGAYGSGTTYNQYEVVVQEGVLYSSFVGSNTGNSPKANNDGEGSHKWTILTNPYIKQITVATLVPTQIDATWTTFKIEDFGYDRADGNFIIRFNTSDSVTNHNYIAKINSASGATMWTLPVSASDSNGWYVSRIQGGVIGYLADDGTTYSINTATGATYISSFSTTGLNLSNVGQVVDSLTGTLIGNYSYNSATGGAPTPLSGTPSTFSATWAIYLPGTAFSPDTQSTSTNSIPVVVGYTYTSKGQLLRPGEPVQTGAQNGPPMGKTRRQHMFSTLFANCVTGTLTFGTDFTRGHIVPFTSAGGTAYTHSQFFNGVYWGTLDDGYSFDSMIAWQISRPYPATICSVGGFIHTQDR